MIAGKTLVVVAVAAAEEEEAMEEEDDALTLELLETLKTLTLEGIALVEGK